MRCTPLKHSIEEFPIGFRKLRIKIFGTLYTFFMVSTESEFFSLYFSSFHICRIATFLVWIPSFLYALIRTRVEECPHCFRWNSEELGQIDKVSPVLVCFSFLWENGCHSVCYFKIWRELCTYWSLYSSKKEALNPWDDWFFNAGDHKFRIY